MKKIIQGLLLLLLLAYTTSSFAETIKMTGLVAKPVGGSPKTGQTTSYQIGDDGYYQKSLPVSGPHYTDNENGIIADNATGLMWVKQPERIIPGPVGVHPSNQIQRARGNWTNIPPTFYDKADLVKDTADNTYWVCASAHTSGGGTFIQDRTANPTYWRQTVWTNSAENLTTPKNMDWTTAITNCENLEYAGYTDWRLPNIKELMSIADYSRVNPLIDLIFIIAPSGWYSSSTTVADTSACCVVFDKNYVKLGFKASLYYVRPVRGGS